MAITIGGNIFEGKILRMGSRTTKMRMTMTGYLRRRYGRGRWRRREKQ
jgi:hypothetical protein